MGRRARGHQPSDAAQHRLAAAIHRTRAELEVQVTEGLLRSELFLETGRPEQAAAALEQQRRRVVDFEGHLRDALAAAAAEAEAEAVLAGVSGVEVLHDDHESVGSRVPQLVAASLALVLGVALAGAFSVGTGRDGLQAAVRIDATDQLSSHEPDVDVPATHDGLSFREPLLRRTPGLSPSPNEQSTLGDAAARAWIAQQDTLLERLGVHLAVRNEVIRDLQHMVGTLVPGTPLADQVWLQVLSDAVAELGTGQDLEASGETDPDAPAEDAAAGGDRDESDEPVAEPSEDPATEDDEPWFGGGGDEATEADGQVGAGDDGDPEGADDAAGTGEGDNATGTGALLPRED